jgi:hypothetical protein
MQKVAVLSYKISLSIIWSFLQMLMTFQVALAAETQLAK